MEEAYAQSQLISKLIQMKLEMGEAKWEDEQVQFFLPVVLHLTDFDWLNIAAENMLIEEDEVIVKNFFAQLQSLMKINENGLHKSVSDILNGVA